MDKGKRGVPRPHTGENYGVCQSVQTDNKPSNCLTLKYQQLVYDDICNF